MRLVHSEQRGFILPSVLLVGLSTLIVGLSLIQTSTSIRSSVENIYYNRVASLAAEAGVKYATYCLKQANYVQPWGPAAGRPNLTQSTDCTGAPLTNSLSALATSAAVSSTFSVGDAAKGTDGTFILSATSAVNRLSSTGTSVRSYARSTLQAVGSPGLHFGKVTYGYYYPSDSSGLSPGAFFAVIGTDSMYRVAGANTFGQLGNGNTTNSSTLLTYTTNGSAKAASAYSNFQSQGYNLFVINQDGTVYGSGLGDKGQLGNGAQNTNNSTPQKFQLPAGEQGVFVAPKGDVTYVLTQNNNIYAAGSCAYGQLGISASGSTDDATSCGANQTTPARVLLPAPNVSDQNTIPTTNIAVDGSSAFVRMAGGKVYGWGYNYWGAFGDGSCCEAFNTPQQIGTWGNSGQPKAVQIAFDGDTLYVVDSNGAAWASGRNDYGQMGLNGSTNYYYTSFQKVPIVASAGTVLQVATDQWTSIFRTSSGQVWGAGYNGNGELGNGATSQTTTKPVQFILPSGVKATYIYNAGIGKSSSGKDINNTFVIGDNGKVYGAGNNTYGQIGNGTVTNPIKTPVAMNVIDGTTVKAQDVITGLGTTVVLSTDGIYYSVGNNTYGQLGDGTTNNATTPITAKYLRTIPAYLF